MADAEARPERHEFPIVYGHRKASAPEGGVRLAWVLFLVLGVPFALMTILTVLARAGIYVDVFRPLWAPWPPDLLKPFLGLAVFALTLAYLMYRMGRRNGYRSGELAGEAAGRAWAADRYAEAQVAQPPTPAPDAAVAGEDLPPPPADVDAARDEM